jgi:DNA repair protein RadD
MIQPRYYQADAVQALWKYFMEGNTGNPLLALPTGTGKSVVIALFLQSALQAYPSSRFMVLTHVKELIAQNYEKFRSLWPSAPAGIYSSGLKRKDSYMPVTFGGIASVKGKGTIFGKIDIVIIDEAHLVSPSEATMYNQFLTELKVANPALKVVGLTATPWRLGHGRIDEDGLFTDTCYDLTGRDAFTKLISEGFLAPLIPKQTSVSLDTEGVHLRGGEFVASELQFAVDKAEITRAAIQEMMAVASDRAHWLIFASGTDHTDHIAEQLNAFGVPAVAVHSKMTDAQRDANIEAFTSGRVRAAVNNNVLTTGFDFPGIDMIGVLRPTASPVLWVQMLGRGTRPFAGKNNCLVLDFARNTVRLGPINDPVIPRKRGKGSGDAPVKTCEVCETYNHASATHCVNCGAQFHFAVKITANASTSDLIAGEMVVPQVECFAVDHVVFSVHVKAGSSPMVKASYYCGLNCFREFVGFDHSSGFVRKKAKDWWVARAPEGVPPPANTYEAMKVVNTLRIPTHLMVHINTKYPEIQRVDFDGTAFGTKLDDGSVMPVAQVQVPFLPPQEAVYSPAMDDDIPF